MARFPVVLVLVLLDGCMNVLSAQSTSASLTGRVTDPAKALITDAKIAAISTNIDVEYDATTDASGRYSLLNLPPGPYQLEIEKPGYKRLIKPDVVLHVQDALELDFSMTIGPVTETITVEGGTPLINTESATVSTVVDRTFADNLPLNGRSFQTLFMLTPGVVVTPTAFDDQGQFSVNGQRADGNYFTVDGVSANFGVTGYFPLVQAGGGALPALSAQGGTNSLVSAEAMQEFRVQTSSFAPEFGRTPGGQVSIVTRSGTNAFYGTVFDYFRNDVLNANDWFNGYTNTPPLPKAKERQNDFGGVFGGPILKDQTFFFLSYEGLRLRQPSTQETVVPDNTGRQDVPASIQPFLKTFPLANGAEVGNGLAKFDASYTNPSSLDAYGIRVDQVVNSKITLFGRYSYSPSNVDQRAPEGFSVLSTRELISSTLHNFTVGLNQLITPHLSNEVRANYGNQRVGEKFVLDSFGGATPFPETLVYPPGYSSANGGLLLYVVGAGEYVQGKIATDEQRQINLIDNLSLTEGSHQMKLGVDYRWLSPFSSPFQYRQYAQFSGVACPAPPASCNGYAQSGKAAYAQTSAWTSDALLEHNISFFGQDTWRVSPHLTLTYGLRWDINPPLKGKNLENQPFTVTGLNDPATLALAPRGTPLYQTTYGNVAPRVGLAYQTGSSTKFQTVLRSGFGVFYDLGYGSLGGVSTYFPYYSSNIFITTPFPLSAQQAVPPAITTYPPVGSILVADPHLRLPRTYEWNAALAQSLGMNQSMSWTYIGAVGRDLLRATYLFNPNPNFRFVDVTDNSASSNYQALQVKFERRLSRGLQALASYTWSHSLDNASTDAFANYLNTPSSAANPSIDRGNSDFDIRNSFSAGVTYALPLPRWNNVVRATFGGWLVDGFILSRTAPPVDVTSGLVHADGSVFYPRPNAAPGVPQELHGDRYPGGKILNAAAFTAAPTGQQGDFGRNVLRAFGTTQADVAFERQFQFTERVQLRFRGEFFNLFNHPNFGPPTNNLTSALFGYSTATLASSLGSGGANGGLNPIYQIGGPRSIQLALKLQF